MEESWSISLQLLQFNLKRGGQRIATMLMYLSDDVEGGETYFPMVIPFSLKKMTRNLMRNFC